MRLDPKRTLDELIASLAPDEADARSRALEPHLPRAVRARSPARRSSARSPSSTSWTARATSTRSCSTRRRRATRSTSSTRRLAWCASSTGARCACCSPRAASRRASQAAPARRCSSVLGRLTGGDGAARDHRVLRGRSARWSTGSARARPRSQALLREPDTTFVLVSSPRREARRGGDRVRGRARPRRADGRRRSSSTACTRSTARRAAGGRARVAARARGWPGWCARASTSSQHSRRPTRWRSRACAQRSRHSSRCSFPSSPARSTTSAACAGRALPGYRRSSAGTSPSAAQ